MSERVPALKPTPSHHVMVRCILMEIMLHIVIKLTDLYLDPNIEREWRVCLWESRLLRARVPSQCLLQIWQWGGLSFGSSRIPHSKKSIACDQKVHKWPNVQSAGQQWGQTRAPRSQLNSVMVQLDQHIALSTSLINIRMDLQSSLKWHNLIIWISIP